MTQVVISNQSGLPDDQIRNVIAERWVELAAFDPTMGNFQSPQSTPRSLFVRPDYARPTNPIEEMDLAIRLAEEDDDVGNTIGMMSAVAFAGMKNQHADEKTLFGFNAVARTMNLDLMLRDIYEGLLTYGQVYPVKVYVRQKVNNFQPGQSPTLVLPNMVFLNPLSVRVIGMNAFGTPQLAQIVDAQTHVLLTKLFSETTSPAEKNEIKKNNPLAAVLYTEPYEPPLSTTDETLAGIQQAWILNPTMVSRYALTSRRSQSNYAPLLMKRIFGLCEAKRLLNLADYALLNGAINFLVIVRKGNDAHPAHPSEITNLQSMVRAAARSGVMVGDHRLEVEVIMPKMDAMLDDSKRSLLGRKISKALLRLPDVPFGRVDGGGTPESEIASRVLMSDRLLIRRMIEADLYADVEARNAGWFSKGTPKMWFPPIMLSGNKFFTDFVLKLRDRGDIPRSWAIEAAGYDSEAAMADRQREISNGFDDVMTAVNVPNASDNNGAGRPRTADGGATGDDDNPPRPVDSQ